MTNAWDFFKPDLAAEYVRLAPVGRDLPLPFVLTFFPSSLNSQPTVDGPLTLTSYLGALDAAYSTYKTKYTKKYSSDHAHAHAHPLTNGNGDAKEVANHTANGDKAEDKAVKVAVEAESFDYILFHS